MIKELQIFYLPCVKIGINPQFCHFLLLQLFCTKKIICSILNQIH